jgi:hypothetical protein
MKHPIFHDGEDCYARVPSSGGLQLIECEITGPLTRRAVRDLDGKPMGYALAYKVLLDGATRESLFVEGDLRKRWKRGDWVALKNVWQPKREAR